jgi:16S rRNA (guanine(966)-N(2))-methyltransferase RsmD
MVTRMRIIGGQAAGRRLAPVRGGRTRPTGARVREALFNIWQSRIVEATFLDAYAGTGAMGLEAISRGARHVTFCEPDRRALKTIYENIQRMGVASKTRVLGKTLEAALPHWATEGPQFDIIFCDPPWQVGLMPAVVKMLWQIVNHAGIVVVESRASDPVVELNGLSLEWTRRYGDTRVSQYLRNPD